MNCGDEVLSRQRRSTIAAEAKRQRPGFLRQADQAIEVASGAWAVDQHWTKDRERNTRSTYRVLGGKFGTAIGVGRTRFIGLAQHFIGGRPALRPDRRNEHKMANANGL